jgi:hypothetical protein
MLGPFQKPGRQARDLAARLKAAGMKVSTFDGMAYKHREIDGRIGRRRAG